MAQASSSLSAREASILAAVLHIVSVDGLDRVSIREVAKAADVSIGTVQHYFPTKDEMLVAAYHEVVARIRARMEAVRLGDDMRANLSAVLRQVLPLDRERIVEVKVHLAFAARAATMPALAAIQRTVLAELHGALVHALQLGFGAAVPRRRCVVAAHAVMAVADGLALHAVSSGTWLSRQQQAAALDAVLAAVVTSAGSP